MRKFLIRLAEGLRSLPTDLVFLALATLSFASITALISRVGGCPFVLPAERVSPALGINPALPLQIAIVGYLASQVLKVRWQQFQSSQKLSRCLSTDFYYILIFVVVVYFHFHLKMWMPVLNPDLRDYDYLQIDEQLDLVIKGFAVIRSLLTRLLPAPDLWYQGAQLSLFIGSFWLHAVGERRWHHHNVLALLLLLMIGPLTYLLAPAVGPFIFEDGPNATATIAQHDMYRRFAELQVQGPSWLWSHGGQYFTAPPAAMPSLHVGVACIVVYYSLQARSPFASLAIFLAAWIFIESVVSRWHYLVDLPAGILLAALVIAITNRVCRWRHAAPTTSAAWPQGHGSAAPVLSSSRDHGHRSPPATKNTASSGPVDSDPRKA